MTTTHQPPSSGPAASGDREPPGPAALSAGELAALGARPGTLTAAEVTALHWLTGGTPGPHADLAEPAGCGDPGDDAVAEVLDAGFTHRYPAPGATGFAAGGPRIRCCPARTWPGRPR